MFYQKVFLKLLLQCLKNICEWVHFYHSCRLQATKWITKNEFLKDTFERFAKILNLIFPFLLKIWRITVLGRVLDMIPCFSSTFFDGSFPADFIYNHVHNILRLFLWLSKFSFPHKWSEAWLLAINWYIVLSRPTEMKIWPVLVKIS